MAYDVNYSDSQDVALQTKVRMSMLVQAANITSEAGATANHTARSTLATKVANNPEAWVQPFAQAACAGGGITKTSTDTQIDNRLSAIWNLMSGGL